MKNKFRFLPEALKKQVVRRFWLGVLALDVFLLIVIFTRDIILSLPCIFLATYLFIDGGIVLYCALAKKYVVVHGICSDIERTGIRKRIKSIYLQTEDKVVKVPVRCGLKRIAVGNELALYMSLKTRVYERDNHLVVSSYYALEIIV